MTTSVESGAAERIWLRRIQGGISMRPRTTRFVCLVMTLLTAGSAGPSALADPLYTITDLGTLNGQSSSVATAINNQGQVVGISYNGADGSFVYNSSGSTIPPRFVSTGTGATSFLYSGGQLTQINPTGGLAMSINNSGQVVGGQYSSINDLGQYVGGQNAGIQTDNPNTTSVLVSGGTTTILPPLFVPYSINASDQVAGVLLTHEFATGDFHAAVYQNGQITDMSSNVPNAALNSDAIAINQNGDMLISVAQAYQAEQSYLYQAGTGKVINLSGLPGGSGLIASALNDKDQVVGNGFLYSNGTIQALTSLISSGTGWSNLNATAINDSAQIVGQGQIDGQEHAFLMTPIAMETPEPAALITWSLLSTCLAIRFAMRRSRHDS